MRDRKIQNASQILAGVTEETLDEVLYFLAFGEWESAERNRREAYEELGVADHGAPWDPGFRMTEKEAGLVLEGLKDAQEGRLIDADEAFERLERRMGYGKR